MSDNQRRCIWIVDDSALDAERARRALSESYAVDVFADGASAIEQLATVSRLPDVLALDWMMPGVSGIEVCRFIRASDDPDVRHIGVLMVTVHQRTEQVVEGLEAGANDFISKPYAEAELRARVDALVRQKELLERAERAEGALRLLFTSSPDPFIGLDDDGYVTYLNPEAEAVLAIAGAAAEGRHVTDLLPELESWEPDDDKQPATRADLHIGGELYAPAVSRTPAGRGARRVVTLRNVTKQRAREAEKLDFYSVIAHDLRSPLSSALMRTELILDGMHGTVVPGVGEDLRKVQRSLRELIAMVNDFLEIARYEGGAQQTATDLVDLVGLSHETADDFKPLSDASRLTLRVSVPDAPVEVRGDRRRLKQVLSNLVANAIKFTPDGGNVTIGLRVDDHDAVVTVADTGRGISADALPTLFERYARAIDHEHEVVGTGLGLMIVRETVRAHGGSVGVESAPNRGSTFWFRLPLSEARTSAAPDAHASTSS